LRWILVQHREQPGDIVVVERQKRVPNHSRLVPVLIGNPPGNLQQERFDGPEGCSGLYAGIAGSLMTPILWVDEPIEAWMGINDPQGIEPMDAKFP
jgi:hypothetical protein